MVYYRFILCLLLVQLTSLNVSRVLVDANFWRKLFTPPRPKPAVKKAAPAPKKPVATPPKSLTCSVNIPSFNVYGENKKVRYFIIAGKNNNLSYKSMTGNSGLLSFEINSKVPFCIDIYTEGIAAIHIDGLPVKKPILKMRIYHCNNTARVFYFSTGENPDGEWYKRTKGTNNFTKIDDLKGQTPDKANQCKIFKLIDDTGCSYANKCPQDIPMKQQTGGNILKEDAPVKPYIKYTFTPDKSRALGYDGRPITWTDRHKKGFKALTANGIDKVTVYYWNVERNTRPLLLELKKGNKSTFYRNLGDGGDEKWQLDTVADDVELEDVLDDGNCYLNNALGADITFAKRKYLTADFCTRCRMRANFKEESVKTKDSDEIMYDYLFTLDPEYKLTKIRYDDAITNKRTSITIPNLTLPTANVLSFRFYYCNHNPALIYMEEKGQEKKGKWYKRNGSNWTHLSDMDGKTPSNAEKCEDRIKYTTMLQELGCSFKPGKCTVIISPSHNKVTVDISQNPDTKSYVPNASTVEVRVSEPTEIDDFQKIVHTTSQGTFTLSSVHHAITTTNIPATATITGVEVYYWKFDEDYAGPLLVKLSRSGGDLWFENTGVGEHKNAGWKSVENVSEVSTVVRPVENRAGASDVSTDAKLIEKLKVVNCRINHAYTFDLSKEVNYDSFCLNIKVEVIKDIINDLGYTKYAHNTDVVPFTLLALNNPPNDDMGLPDLTGQPMRNVSGVYVFKPKNEVDPPMVYIETADKVHSGWYGNVTVAEEDEEEEEEEEEDVESEGKEL